MRLALIADTFPPLRTSGAVQLRDLAREFARQGHRLTVMLPTADLDGPWQIEDFDGAEVLRLKAPRTKDIGYARRTLAELAMPFAMARNLEKSPLGTEKWDGVIWYAPSIFHGPLAQKLKRKSSCRGYLIVRDIFPEWAVDMGLMGRGLPYRFFDAVARYQYSVADVIGIQTEGNRAYFGRWLAGGNGRRLEVLQNWLDKPASRRSTIRVDDTSLSGRRIFVYAGNMGVAQGLDIMLDLAARMKDRHDVGFLFVGRGSEAARLRARAEAESLSNMVFFDEIDPDEIPDLYAQCSAGLVALDHRHKSHNIPGKFLTYMQSGLPVLANVNTGNDLVGLIRDTGVGDVSDSNDIDDLVRRADNLLQMIGDDAAISGRCRALFEQRFSAGLAVQQIISALKSPAASDRPLSSTQGSARTRR